jgi:hypothetical protein
MPRSKSGIQAQLRTGKGMLKVAREIGVGVGTVQRVKERRRHSRLRRHR